MPIHGDIQSLPRSKGEDGFPPSKNNFVAVQLAEAWFADHQRRGEMEYARLCRSVRIVRRLHRNVVLVRCSMQWRRCRSQNR